MIQRQLFKYKFLFTPSFYNFATKPESVIKSVPGNKPPMFEDSVHGKYAGVLFGAASEKEQLDLVLEDMKFFKELNGKSEEFRNFLFNTAFKRGQQVKIHNVSYFIIFLKLQVLQSLGTSNFNPLTNNFVSTLIDNRRLDSLAKIADKYIEYYRILNKEESITIVSAQNLNEDQKAKVKKALEQGRGSTNFTLNFSVDPSILGGLQMYSGLEFLDCSLLSRVQKLKQELQKISF